MMKHAAPHQEAERKERAGILQEAAKAYFLTSLFLNGLFLGITSP